MKKIIENKSCVGCSACVSKCPKNCIELRKDEKGFLYPVIKHSSECIECGICEKVCPVLEKAEKDIGLPVAYATYTKVENIRVQSSSGGIFSELAQMILDKDGVVYGAAYDENCMIHHIAVDNKEDLSKLRGAKYAQSDLKDSFVRIKSELKSDRFVLFSGTPCQVAGLKSFLKQDYDNLICVDFVCHGVPSPMAWEAYLKYRMKEDQEESLPVAINLRSKKTGWSRYQYSTEFAYADGRVYSCKNGENLFMELFVGDYINRESCTDCQFKGYSRVSDFTLGDFWGIWDIDSSMDDDKGTSLVLVQSEKAKKIWNEIHSKINCKEVTLEQASQQNPSLLVSSKANENREKAFELIRSGKIEDCEQFFVDNSGQNRSLCRLLRRILKNIFVYWLKEI